MTTHPGEHVIETHRKHVEDGLGVREIARRLGVAPSTVTRRIRRANEMPDMLTTADADDRDVVRVLRRINEKGAVLVSAIDMATAIVVRGDVKTCSTTRKTVETLFCRELIARTGATARIEKYEPTKKGRQALNDILEAKRKKGSVGAYWLWQKGFLDDELLALAEKLTDDAEAGRPSFDETVDAIGGDMGMVLRMLLKDRLSLEAIEKRMGYSARSGKVVIKIALQQVARG